MDSFFISQRLFFGDKLNERIFNSSATIVGLGGLGSWIAEILTRIGIKRLNLVDFDIVEEKNLNRQNFTLKDRKKYKIDAIEERLKEIREDIDIKKYQKIHDDIFDTDIFFDAVDDINTKFLLNEYSVYLNKPYIFGSVVMSEGYVGLINPKDFCFYDIFSNKTNFMTCNLYGVDPASVIFASSLMVELFLKYLDRYNNGILYHFNLKRFDLYEVKVRKNNCKICVRKEYERIWK
ncbi:SAMP-activating enzyme E1 [Nanobdella aerobiophila]|uniref:SAMP-activating enzyme E1 n=1 Tax=Nanobdella aerobiophila TaxID=2586965 RepID=A0A915SSG9_9ARCH|nr:ThiF family adenylyltransferase [Nanobdella aerobiophila]BBL45396.1 SAMP-activating enzyme E1 [Nanobdella aerobiophila]